MIGGIFGGALSQLLKLGREYVIHAECLREFFGDIRSVGAPGVQIHFLENAQIGFELADLFFNVVQILAAIDIPIQNGGAGVKTGGVSIVSRYGAFARLRREWWRPAAPPKRRKAQGRGSS